jgi:predicted phage terminase large subunit-like protein
MIMPFKLTKQRLLEAVLRQDFTAFSVKVVQTVSPGDPFIMNWHITALTHALSRVQRRRVRRLIVNMPPRSLKSLITSVAFVAWVLGHDPARVIACVSYSAELGALFHRLFRLVVNSEWYRALFPCMRIAKETETEAVTTLGGRRYVVGFGGSFTGQGAHIIIVDDPLRADDAQSDKVRGATNEWFRTTVFSRLDDKENGAIIVVAQRLHEDDLPGNLLAEGGWESLVLPAYAEEDLEIPIGPNVVHYYRRGEVLQPDREPRSLLEEIERIVGPIIFAAQYQQAPVPAKGNLVQREWLQFYDQPPVHHPGTQILQSWDVATSLSATSDYSVCTTWHNDGGKSFLLDVWRGRLLYPDLKSMVVTLARQHRANVILIEYAGSGRDLVQEFKAHRVLDIPTPIGVPVVGDKAGRMVAQTARFAAGDVYLPRHAPWLTMYMNELLAFPNGRHDDMVDSTSQYLNCADGFRRWVRRVATGGIMVFSGTTQILPRR